MSDELVAFAVSYAVIAVVVCAGAWWFLWRGFCDGKYENISDLEIKDPLLRRYVFIFSGVFSVTFATSWLTLCLLFIILKVSMGVLDSLGRRRNDK